MRGSNQRVGVISYLQFVFSSGNAEEAGRINDCSLETAGKK
jgi:hypothetical protein